MMWHLMRLFVGNIPWDFSSEDLRRLFAEVGEVDSAAVVKDRVNGRSMGFGFVAMGSKRGVEAAIAKLDGSTVRGRELKVHPARTRTSVQAQVTTQE
jgi:RNA recognition motif-containing protein